MLGSGTASMKTALVAVLAAFTTTAVAEPLTTHRNSLGQVTGSAQQRGNTTVFTDRMGQQVGTSVLTRNGTTTFFNARGAQVGAAGR